MPGDNKGKGGINNNHNINITQHQFGANNNNPSKLINNGDNLCNYSNNSRCQIHFNNLDSNKLLHWHNNNNRNNRM